MRRHQIVSSLGADCLPVLDALCFIDDDTVPAVVSYVRSTTVNHQAGLQKDYQTLKVLTTCTRDPAALVSLWPCVEHQSSAPPDASWTPCEFLSVETPMSECQRL